MKFHICNQNFISPVTEAIFMVFGFIKTLPAIYQRCQPVLTRVSHVLDFFGWKVIAAFSNIPEFSQILHPPPSTEVVYVYPMKNRLMVALEI